eukprot:gene12049-12139_t
MVCNGTNYRNGIVKSGFTALVLLILAGNVQGTAYNWKGATSSDWNTASNWSPSGIPGSGDAVSIGVVSFTNQPILGAGTTTVNISSLTFGTIATIVLTLNSGYTLNVSGAITQNPSNLNYGTLNTTLAGAGAINCSSIMVGDNITLPPLLANNYITLISKIANLHDSGGLTVYSGGTTLIDGSLYTADFTYGILPLTVAQPKISVDIPSGSSLNPVLQLTSGTGTSTVYYNGSTQTVYTTTNTVLDANPQTYQYLVLSGAGIKTVGESAGGLLTVANDLTSSATSVLFSTYNPTVTIGGNWTNSGGITQGSGNITVSGSLTNNSGGTLNLGTANLYIAGNYTNNVGGVYTQSTGTTYFNGTGAQSLTDNSTTGTTFKLVNFSGGGTATMNAGTNNVNFSVASTGILTMSNNSKLVAGTLTTGGSAYLTLISDANSSASVAAITGTSSITGNVGVQRYLTGSAGSAGGGFDKTGNPTIYLYREDLTPSNASFTGGNFWGIREGYMFFFRGDRGAASVATETVPSYVPVAVAATATGFLTQGQVIVHNWYTPSSAYLGYTGTGTGTNYAVRGFNLVGNPYASSIDWEQFNNSSTTTGIYATSNISSTVYELNPLTYNYDTYQKGGIATNHGTRTIVSGQGFFVLATNNANPQLIFNESAKSTLQNTGLNLFMDTKAAMANLNSSAVHQFIRLRLEKDSVNTDDTYVGFDANASAKYVEGDDAIYITGNGQIPFPKQQQIKINLMVKAQTDGTYTLRKTDLQNIPKLYEIWLQDAYTKDSLDIRNNSVYVFNLAHADTNTYGSRRFSLIIRQNPALGVHLLNFTATKVDKGAQIAWTTENEADYTTFTVERSIDGGVNFGSLESASSNSSGSYSFLDSNPMLPSDQYRLKITDLNGSVTYSGTITIKYNTTNLSVADNQLIVYPNPASNMINISINSTDIKHTGLATQSLGSGVSGISSVGSTVYGIKIISSVGTVVRSEISGQADWQDNVSSLLPGTYIIQAPSISYSSSNYTFAAGTAITTLTPTNANPVTGIVPAQIYGQVTTLAGSAGVAGYTNATGTSAVFNTPVKGAIDGSGNLYVCDFANNRIRKITPAGVVTTFAGSGTSGVVDGFGTAAQFFGSSGIVIDPTGLFLYVADNSAIRRITIATAQVVTIAGPTGITTEGSTDGVGAAARFMVPSGMAFDNAGLNLYVADAHNNEIRKIVLATNTVSTYAGSTTAGSTDGAVGSARFSYPQEMVNDGNNNLYVVDQNNNKIRKINLTTNTVSTFAGSGVAGFNNATGTAAQFNSPWGITRDGAGNFYVDDNGNNQIREITPAGVVTTFAGNVTSGTTDGVLTAARFKNPYGITTATTGTLEGNMFAADLSNNTIRQISLNGYTISPTLPAGLAFDGTTGNISGTPTAAAGLTSYTVTAYNYYGTSVATFNIAVIGPPSAPGVSTCSNSAGTITASGGSPTGGNYNWYSASSGGTALQSSTSTTYTTPALTTATTYYVSYSLNGVESARTPVTVSINSAPVISQYPSSASANLTLSLPFSGNANDVSGNGNNGTVQNGAALTLDRYNAYNSAYAFNGSNQFISTANSLSAPSTFSISTWFKTTTTSGGAIVGFNSSQTGSGTNYDRAVYMNNAGLIYFGVSNGTYIQTINTTTSYNDGKWHNVVATFSSTTGEKLYIDGALTVYNTSYVGYTGYTGFWRVANSNFNGNWASTPSSNYFAGSIDDVAIYNREVTSTEVYSLNGAGSVPFCPNGTLTLQANTVTGATYAWTGPNGFTSSLQNPTISNATSTNIGTYTVTVTNATGCSSQATATTSLSSVPTSTFSLPAAAYPNTSTTVTYSGTDPSTSTFTWNFGSGTVISGSGMGPYQVQWASAGTQTVTLTVTNANGCSSSTTTHTININSTSWYSTYVYRKKITFDQTQISGTQANFPVLVKIVDADLVYTPGLCTNKVQSATLNDLAFVDGTAPQSAELPYEIDTYDGTTGTLLVWVQVPSFSSSGAGNSLYYYFGSTAPPAHAAASSTWASDYKAVYHFNEKTLNSAVGGVKESTSNASNATTSNMTAASLTTGQIGGAYTFSNSSISTGSNLDVLGDHTLSAWVYTNNTGLDQKVMTNQNASNYYGYKLGSYFGAMETENQTAGYGYSATRGSTPIGYIAANTWYYVQGVASGTQLSVYVNGVQYATTTVTIGSTTTGSTFYIGVGESGNQYYWSGVIDEVRVSTVAKSSSWIQTEYNNQRNPASTGSNHFISSIANIEYNTTNFNAGYSPGSLIYTWTGASGTSVTTAANWNITSVTPNVATTAPSSQYASIAIPGGLSGYPILNASFSVYSLTMASGSQFNLNGNSLIMGCDIVNTSNGQILYSNNTSSTINWNGALATQNYYGSTISGTGQTGNMIVNNTAAGTINIASGKFDIYNTLTITKGNLVVGASPATLTLKSTSTLTASVAAIPSPYTITGTVNVERYLQGGAGYRGYRLVSSPVYAGGFDKAGNPTLYLFREDLTPYNKSFTGGNFWGISTINNSTPYNYYLNSGSTSYNLPVGSGYMMFFRGDRTAASLATETTAGYVPVAATVTASGSLTQGQVIAHEWYTPTSPYLNYTGSGGGTNAAVRGFNLLGNPYASSIDWEQYNNSSTTTGIYATSNVSNTVYELNPLTYNYDTYQQGGIYTNNGTRTIASGQGFFVLATNSSNPQLIFNETAKTSLQNTGAKLFMSTKAELASLNSTTVDQHLRIRLSVDSINTDDTYIGFKSTANVNYIVNEDALYIQGNGKVGAVADGLYTLKRTEMAAIPQLYEIWLMDAYKKDSLDMRANDTYAFNLALADTNSYGSRRFTLVIRQNPALGVHLLSFTAAQAKGGALRSTDGGVTFTTVGGFGSSAVGSYNFTDTNLVKPGDAYRLKITDLNGAVTYSNVVTIMYANTGNNVTNTSNTIIVYPNPAKSVLNLQIIAAIDSNSAVATTQSIGTGGTKQTSSAANTVYAIKIVNNLGLVIKSVTTAQQNWQTDVNSLVPGTYIIQVLNNKDNSLVGRTAFVKL